MQIAFLCHNLSTAARWRYFITVLYSNILFSKDPCSETSFTLRYPQCVTFTVDQHAINLSYHRGVGWWLDFLTPTMIISVDIQFQATVIIVYGYKK